MTVPLNIRVYDNRDMLYSTVCQMKAELGRQGEGEKGPYYEYQKPDPDKLLRVVIARYDEPALSRQHACIESLSRDRIKLTNLSKSLPIRLADGTKLEPRETCELALPAVFLVGTKTIRVERDDISGPPLLALDEATRAPGDLFTRSSRLAGLALPFGDQMQAENLIGWLQTTMEVLHSAASSPDFFDEAAQAAVDLVRLDTVWILLLDKEEWKTEAIRTSPHLIPEPQGQPSKRILTKLREAKRTFWQVPSATGESLMDVKAVGAAPILDPKGEVIGAVYGDRRHGPGNVPSARGPITKVEAMLVELLASTVAAGLARLKHEQEAIRARVQFEQFFTPELSSQLAAHPDLLEGREEEITILFCDIRGFSAISERLGSAQTVNWMHDVMGELSQCVMAQQGVLVDYIGDELMAMWGAPVKQPDHARLACKAAIAMLDRLPTLNARWAPTLGTELRLGIGLNTGVAQVGNTGSRYKFKYGPLGNTVNLASRVQGATKYLKTSLLITGTTRQLLDDSFACRRLLTVRMVNIGEPVDLYEVSNLDKTSWAPLQQATELALAEFEKQSFRQAARILGNHLVDHPEDKAALVLMSRVVHFMVEEPAVFDPIWNLPTK